MVACQTLSDPRPRRIRAPLPSAPAREDAHTERADAALASDPSAGCGRGDTRHGAGSSTGQLALPAARTFRVYVPWDGGVGCGPTDVPFPTVPETLQRWRTRYGCASTTVRTLEQGDGHSDTSHGCREHADVTLCAVEGGGHNWPGGEPPAGLVACPGNGFQSTTFHASEVIWRFLAAHPQP